MTKKCFLVIILFLNTFSAAYAASAKARPEKLTQDGYPIEKIEAFVRQEAAKVAAADSNNHFLYAGAALLVAYFTWPHISKAYADQVSPWVKRHERVNAAVNFAQTQVMPFVIGEGVQYAKAYVCAPSQQQAELSRFLSYIMQATDLLNLGNNMYFSSFVGQITTMQEFVEKADTVIAVLIENAFKVAAYVYYHNEKNAETNFSKKEARKACLINLIKYIQDLKNIQPEARNVLVQEVSKVDGNTVLLVQLLQKRQMELIRAFIGAI